MANIPPPRVSIQMPSRDDAHRWLDTFLNQVEADQAATVTGARTHLIHLAMLVADIAGQQLASVAFPDICDSCAKADHLQQLADKLAISGRILGRLDGAGNAYSIQAAVREIRSAAGGDEPKLFSNRTPGSKDEVNSYRLSTHRLVALQWKEYLVGRGGAPASRFNDLVAEAYGDSWETIRKWKKPLEDRLGRNDLAEALKWAGECGSAKRPFKHRLIPSSDEDALVQDGRTYAREKGRKDPPMRSNPENIGQSFP